MLDMAVAKEAIRIKNCLKGYEGSEGYDPHYCKHGNYVGTWWGPDYMCGPCEDGAEDYAYALYWAKEGVRERMRRFLRGPFLNVVKTEEFKDLTEAQKGEVCEVLLELNKRYF